jgi:hypothetical protein
MKDLELGFWKQEAVAIGGLQFCMAAVAGVEQEEQSSLTHSVVVDVLHSQVLVHLLLL